MCQVLYSFCTINILNGEPKRGFDYLNILNPEWVGQEDEDEEDGSDLEKPRMVDMGYGTGYILLKKK